MKEKMIEFLDKGQIPIYHEEKQVIREFIETFFENNQPERSKREDLKKCVICECERPVKESPNGVCNDCSEDSTFADSF